MTDKTVRSERKGGAWPEWAVRALCALARRILHERNATCGGDWPAGQDWHELGHTSQHAFMRAAREECGVPHEAYRDAVQAICDSQEFDLDLVWQDMDARSEKSGYSPPAPVSETGPLQLDTDRQVFFYEQDHYYLSNFSAFKVGFCGRWFDTAEQAYHFQRFASVKDQNNIIDAKSAHDAFRYAQDNKARQIDGWDELKVPIMRDILRAKARQHEYVRRKLLQTGDRALIENSWRDAYWGWGENRDGLNMLGKLWMEVRAELRAAPQTAVPK
jgi:ribA/ribD-fused uncharacterized protein